MCTAFGNSLIVGGISTLAATALGTAIAIALVRYRFRGRTGVSLLLFMPMATPEVVIGAGLAAQFLTAGINKGLVTIILAHTMFCSSFVVVTVRARVMSLDPALEEAGRTSTYRRARCSGVSRSRCCSPASPAAALLSFSLSFDDFIITYFTSGNVQTFPACSSTWRRSAASRRRRTTSASAALLIAIVAMPSGLPGDSRTARETARPQAARMHAPRRVRRGGQYHRMSMGMPPRGDILSR